MLLIIIIILSNNNDVKIMISLIQRKLIKLILIEKIKIKKQLIIIDFIFRHIILI